jgi:hypothetical protein
VTEEFLNDNKRPVWANAKPGEHIPFPKLKEYIQLYEEPKNVPGNLQKINDELEATRATMNQVIEDILKRGETIDGLVEQSKALSGSSAVFAKQVCIFQHSVLSSLLTCPQAKKQNSCCVLM